MFSRSSTVPSTRGTTDAPVDDGVEIAMSSCCSVTEVDRVLTRADTSCAGCVVTSADRFDGRVGYVALVVQDKSQERRSGSVYRLTNQTCDTAMASQAAPPLALHVTLGHSLRWFCVRQTVPALAWTDRACEASGPSAGPKMNHGSRHKGNRTLSECKSSPTLAGSYIARLLPY